MRGVEDVARSGAENCVTARSAGCYEAPCRPRPCSSDPFIVRPPSRDAPSRAEPRRALTRFHAPPPPPPRPTQSIARLSFELYTSGNSLTNNAVTRKLFRRCFSPSFSVLFLPSLSIPLSRASPQDCIVKTTKRWLLAPLAVEEYLQPPNTFPGLKNSPTVFRYIYSQGNVSWLRMSSYFCKTKSKAWSKCGCFWMHCMLLT